MTQKIAVSLPETLVNELGKRCKRDVRKASARMWLRHSKRSPSLTNSGNSCRKCSRKPVHLFRRGNAKLPTARWAFPSGAAERRERDEWADIRYGSPHSVRAK